MFCHNCAEKADEETVNDVRVGFVVNTEAACVCVLGVLVHNEDFCVTKEEYEHNI